MVISLVADCKSMVMYGKSDSRQGKAYVFINFEETKI